MQINGVGNKAILPPSVGTAGSPGRTPANGNGGTTAASDGYAPSAQLVQLTQLAQQQDDVRPDLVQAVRARLASGAYSTPASAEQTAEAMLNALD